MIKPCNSTDMPPANNQIAADANRGGPCASAPEPPDKIDLREQLGANFLRTFGAF